MNDEEGLRGCWFEGRVAQLSGTHALVAYDELQDGETGEALQEWFPLPGHSAQPDLPAGSAQRVHPSAAYLLRPSAPPEVGHLVASAPLRCLSKPEVFADETDMYEFIIELQRKLVSLNAPYRPVLSSQASNDAGSGGSQGRGAGTRGAGGHRAGRRVVGS